MEGDLQYGFSFHIYWNINTIIRLTYSGEGKAGILGGTSGLLTATLAGTIGGIYLEI